MDKRRYQPLTLPTVAWQKSLTSTAGTLVAQPLEPGFGFTMGNALRRVLLGGVEGSAVTSIIIKGVNNEFSPLKGVVEDAMQVILNIKQIVIRNKTGKPGVMKLHVTGEAVARAGDMQGEDHLEIVNPDLVLAHVAASGILDIEFYIETGRGYRPAAWPVGKSLQEDDRIYLDAMFSPVRRVTYDVEKTRVGKDIDYDKLILTVVTDGSESPADVVHYAVSVMRTQLENFLVSPEIPFNDMKPAPVITAIAEETAEEVALVESEDRLKGISDLLLKPIDVLEFSVRAHNCLVAAGIRRILDLVNMPEEDVLKIKNFGQKSFDEVKAGLAAFNLSFGMNIKEEDVKKLLEGAQS